MRTGAAISRCSYIAGFGVRSGKTIPSATNAPSCTLSPKSPPYAQRWPGAATPLPYSPAPARPTGLPSLTRWRIPWSQNSQMNPP
ncbi:hypothetical protein SCANM63S_07263 [Streptomyces canarius]